MSNMLEREKVLRTRKTLKKKHKSKTGSTGPRTGVAQTRVNSTAPPTHCAKDANFLAKFL